MEQKEIVFQASLGYEAMSQNKISPPQEGGRNNSKNNKPTGQTKQQTAKTRTEKKNRMQTREHLIHTGGQERFRAVINERNPGHISQVLVSGT